MSGTNPVRLYLVTMYISFMKIIYVLHPSLICSHIVVKKCALSTGNLSKGGLPRNSGLG